MSKDEFFPLSSFERLLNECKIKYVENLPYGRYGFVNLRTKDIYLNKYNSKIDNIETVIHDVMH